MTSGHRQRRMRSGTAHLVHPETDAHQRIVFGQRAARPSLPVDSGRCLVPRIAGPQQQAKSLVPASVQQHIDR
jgi:hypothetical protein